MKNDKEIIKSRYIRIWYFITIDMLYFYNIRLIEEFVNKLNGVSIVEIILWRSQGIIGIIQIIWNK
jgi:hypothetical protein